MLAQGSTQVSVVQLAFVEQPQFSFDVQLYGGDLNMLPGLEEWLTTFVRSTLLKPFILPEVLDLPVVSPHATAHPLILIVSSCRMHAAPVCHAYLKLAAAACWHVQGGQRCSNTS